MKNFLNNIMKNFFDITIDDLYGREEKPNKTAIYVGIFFSITFAILIFILSHINNANMWLNIYIGYFIFLSFSLSFFAFTSYFFQKKKNMNKFKKVKIFVLLFTLILISISFLPVTLLSILSQKIKFTNFFKHIEIYLITFFVSLLISLLVIPYLLLVLYEQYSFLFATNVNYSTILSLLIFATYQCITSLFLYFFHKIGKNKLNDIEYKSIKKDFNVLVFAMITTITVIANCFIFSDIEKELIDGFTKAFAIYIAFDRLIGKWKNLNQQFDQDSKQDSI